MIRPFELLDALTLHRLRKQGVYLDNRAVLTMGTRFVITRALLSPLSEATGVFTGVQNSSGHKTNPLIGQACLSFGAETARMTFLAPEEMIEPLAVEELIEYLLKRLGEHHAQTMLAEVDEDSPAFEVLRRLNFSIFARQQIWRISFPPKKPLLENKWRRCTSLDGINIRKLHFAAIPTLVQQIESKDFSDLNGWVYYQGQELLSFAEVHPGPRGSYVQVYLHPAMEDNEDHLRRLLVLLRPRVRRPVYLCLRSYQPDLSPFLSEIDAEASPRQAVMARRLTARVTQAELAPLPKIKGTTEVTTSMNDFEK